MTIEIYWPMAISVLRPADQWHYLYWDLLTNSILCTETYWQMAFSILRPIDQWHSLYWGLLTNDILYTETYWPIAFSTPRPIDQWHSLYWDLLTNGILCTETYWPMVFSIQKLLQLTITWFFYLYRFPSLIPIYEVDYVVRRIIECILTNREVLYLPESLLVYLAIKG